MGGIHESLVHPIFPHLRYLISLTVILIKMRCYNRNMGLYICFWYGFLGIGIGTGLACLILAELLATYHIAPNFRGLKFYDLS